MAHREEIHVLMVAFTAQGHITPMYRFGKLLVSKGLRVTLAISENARNYFLLSAKDSDSGIHLEFYPDGFDLNYDRKGNLDHYMETLAKVGPVNLSSMIQNYNQGGARKFSCIINNPFVPWAADVAAEHNIPCAMLWIQPITLYAIYYRFYNNLNPFPTSTNPDMNVELPGLPVLNREDVPTFLLPSNVFNSVTKLLGKALKEMKNVKWVLANTFYQLEKDVIESMNEFCPIRPIGPLVPPALLGEDDQEPDAGFDMWKSEDACIDWLDQQQPTSVIYISFGSLTVLQGKDMMNIATALKNTKVPFLWVVKPADHSSKYSAGQLPLDFQEEIRNQGLIVKWSPQTKVLAHPSVACFLSHCGWNSLLESITAGVPILAFPQWSDQPTNAMLIDKVLGVGVRLRRNGDGIVSNEEIEKCIKEIMRGEKSEKLKEKAAGFKNAAREALAVDGSSDKNIRLFVDQIIGNSYT